MASIFLPPCLRVGHYILADFELSLVNDEDSIARLTFADDDLSSMANFLVHAEMQTLERGFGQQLKEWDLREE